MNGAVGGCSIGRRGTVECQGSGVVHDCDLPSIAMTDNWQNVDPQRMHFHVLASTEISCALLCFRFLDREIEKNISVGLRLLDIAPQILLKRAS
jgi:hypothetical protein